MEIDNILKGLYNHFLNELPPHSLQLIIANDIRVENFFLVNAMEYLEQLRTDKIFKSFKVQNHIEKSSTTKRAHIDLKIIDLEENSFFIELKHFSISNGNDGGRTLRFYTSNSTKGKKVGIVGDAEKLNSVKNKQRDNCKFICCAVITNKPTTEEKNEMENRFRIYDELKNWKITYPIPFEEQNENLAMIYLTN